MVVGMGDTYGNTINSVIERINKYEDMEIIGFASSHEEVVNLTRKHYEDNFQD